MTEVMREESDTNHRYRITRTNGFFLLSLRQRDEMGLLLGPAEWLYRTYEAAEKGLEHLMLMNAWWAAITNGYPIGDLPKRCEAAGAEHNSVVERLNDRPLIGEEVRELRRKLDE
jgi:hypothetical protein